MLSLKEIGQMLHPSTSEQYLAGQMGNKGPVKTLGNIFAAGIILPIAGIIGNLVVQFFHPLRFPGDIGLIENLLKAADNMLIFYVSAYLLYLVAKVLGGKGKFDEQIYLQSVVAVPIALIQGLIIILLSVHIPEDLTLRSLLILPMILPGIYSIYMDYKIIKVAHRHERIRAALSIAGFLVTISALLFIIYAAISNIFS